MQGDKEERDLFAAMKLMEQKHADCASKAGFLDNVIYGKEQVTFAVIDRCREAVLQLRQCHHVFMDLHRQVAETPGGLENKARLDQLSSGVDATYRRATAALATILSWVPDAVNTRSVGGLR